METIMRKAVLLTLLAFAFTLTFAVPPDDSQTWIRDLMVSKALGIIGWATFVLLNRKWRTYGHEE